MVRWLLGTVLALTLLLGGTLPMTANAAPAKGKAGIALVKGGKKKAGKKKGGKKKAGKKKGGKKKAPAGG